LTKKSIDLNRIDLNGPTLETADTHRAMHKATMRKQANSRVPTAIMTMITLSLLLAVHQLTTCNITPQVDNISNNNNIYSAVTTA